MNDVPDFPMGFQDSYSQDNQTKTRIYLYYVKYTSTAEEKGKKGEQTTILTMHLY
jgi:hypothetical protein